MLRGKTDYTVDNLVLTSYDQFIFMLKILIHFVTKTRYLNEEVNCTEPSPLVCVPMYEMKTLEMFVNTLLVQNLDAYLWNYVSGTLNPPILLVICVS